MRRLAVPAQVHGQREDALAVGAREAAGSGLAGPGGSARLTDGDVEHAQHAADRVGAIARDSSASDPGAPGLLAFLSGEFRGQLHEERSPRAYHVPGAVGIRPSSRGVTTRTVTLAVPVSAGQ